MPIKSLNVVYRYLCIAVISLYLVGCASTPKQSVEIATSSKTTVATQEDRLKQTLSPADEENYRKALSHMASGEYNEAQKILGKLYSHFSNHAEIASNYALASFEVGDTERTSQLLEAAQSQNKETAELANLAGLVAKKEGEFNKAVAAFERAIQHKRDYALAYYNMALIYDIYFQELPPAIKNYKSYLEYSTDTEANTEVQAWVDQLESSLRN